MYFRYCKVCIAMICGMLLIGFFVSCNDYNPIFASIENEDLIKTANLPDTATIFGMARLNDTYYVATGGAMFHRDVDEDTWDTVSLPSEYEGVSSLIQVNPTTAYSILIKNFYVDISGYALYRMKTSGRTVTFSPIHTMDAADGEIVRLFATYDENDTGNGEIYAVVRRGDKKNPAYDYYQNYQAKIPNTLVERQNGIITDVANVHGTVYLSTESSIYRIDNSEPKLIDIRHPSMTGGIGGMYYSKLYNKLYVSSKLYIWSSVDGGATWTSSSSQSNMFFTHFIEINQSGFAGVLVGTQYVPISQGRDAGYREIAKGDIDNISTPIGNKYTSGNLDTAGVIGFFLDDNTLFVFTKGQGLWRGTYTNGRNIDWFLE